METHRQFATEQNLETLKTLLMIYVCILHSLYCPENISNISQGSNEVYVTVVISLLNSAKGLKILHECCAAVFIM